jgi:hypothetical protein
MSLSQTQSTIFTLTEGLDSPPFWIDSAFESPFGEDTLHLLEGFTSNIGLPESLPAEQLLPSFEDDHPGPSVLPGSGGRANFTVNACTGPFDVWPGDLYAVPSVPVSANRTTDCTFVLHHVVSTHIATRLLTRNIPPTNTTPIYPQKQYRPTELLNRNRR